MSTRGRRPAVVVLYVAFIGLSTILGAETLLRGLGYRAWQEEEVGITVSPGGRLFVKHPRLGYTHLPGRFDVRLGDGYTFRITHLPSTLRMTRPPELHPPGRPGLWLFGCSVTHGWSVNDEQSYPWLVAERFPGYDVQNFGVSGYGTLHSLIQFRDALAAGRGRPAVAILAYADFHDERNTFLRSRRKSVVAWNRLGPVAQPYAHLDSAGRLDVRMATVTYREFPFMRWLALSNLVEEAYDGFEEWHGDSHEVTVAIIEEMARTAARENVAFAVVGLLKTAGTSRTLEAVRSAGVTQGDISFEFAPADLNLPHDPHPSAAGHRKYAERLDGFLSDRMGLR